MSPTARSTQDVLISISHKNSVSYSALKACDTLNGVLVHNVLDDILIRPTDVNHMSDVAQLLNKKGVDLVEDHYAAGVL